MDNTIQAKPIDQSYKVNEMLYAGEYPGDKNNERAASKVKQLVDFGIRHFIDLTEDGELNPYHQLLPEGTTYFRFPVRDCGVPHCVEVVDHLLYHIDECVRQGGMVYLHCWGGVGRTGTIIACYLAKQMNSPTLQNVLTELRRLFAAMPKATYRKTPETREQIEFIFNFIEYLDGTQNKISESCIIPENITYPQEIENLLDEDAIKTESVTRQDLHNKILGSLVGGAIGDALGYPVEFVYSFEEIRAEYGEYGIQDYDKSYPWLPEQLRHYKALFSDDTQMSLYTAEGLLHAENNNRPLVPTICNSYLYWLAGQMGKKYHGNYPSELVKIVELNQRRTPGNTCISALRSIQAGKDPVNNSKGCGGIMRIAPIALYGASHDWSLEKTAKLAGEVAELTHLHQMSTLASACCASIIQQCVTCEGGMTFSNFANIVKTSLECVELLYPDFSVRTDFRALINKVLRLRDNQLADWEIIENLLGGGWIAEETLAIAVFCVARHLDNFKNCVVSAVNHGGDSDSTGAVAGNIIGAILGADAIPNEYKEQLQLYNLISTTAQNLTK